MLPLLWGFGGFGGEAVAAVEDISPGSVPLSLSLKLSSSVLFFSDDLIFLYFFFVLCLGGEWIGFLRSQGGWCGVVAWEVSFRGELLK